MDKKTVMEWLSLLMNVEKSAVAAPNESMTTFKTIDLEKVAMITIIVNEKFAAEEAFIDLQKIKYCLQKINSKDIGFNITAKSTMITWPNGEFTLQNIDLQNAPKMSLRKIKLKTRAIISRNDFLMFLKHANSIAKLCRITIEPTEVTMYAEGEDGDTVVLTVLADQMRELVCSEKKTAMYSIKWLLDFVKSTSAEFITLELENDYPILLKAETPDYLATLIVAPTIL